MKKMEKNIGLFATGMYVQDSDIHTLKFGNLCALLLFFNLMVILISFGIEYAAGVNFGASLGRFA